MVARAKATKPRSRPHWSGEPTIIMWALLPNGAILRHNFYNCYESESAVDRWQHHEYERGYVTWLDYVWKQRETEGTA